MTPDILKLLSFQIQSHFLGCHCFMAVGGVLHEILKTSSSSVQGSVFRGIDALLEEFLEWVVESRTVTHSSADWWDILLPLA